MKFIKNELLARPTRGIFVGSGSVTVTEVAAAAGFDWLLLDLEHGLGTETDVRDMLRCLSSTMSAPIVRIPALREEYFKRFLDWGAAGIMCPMVDTPEQARELVACMRYPPHGRRGLTSASRAAGFGRNFQDYFSAANAQLLCVAQIETPQAVENLDAIAAVDGVDVLFLGHSDLSLQLGKHGEYTSREIRKAEDALLDAANRCGKCAGMLIKRGMDVKEYTARGFSFLALGSDVACLRQEFARLVDDA